MAGDQASGEMSSTTFVAGGLRFRSSLFEVGPPASVGSIALFRPSGRLRGGSTELLTWAFERIDESSAHELIQLRALEPGKITQSGLILL